MTSTLLIIIEMVDHLYRAISYKLNQLLLNYLVVEITMWIAIIIYILTIAIAELTILP